MGEPGKTQHPRYFDRRCGNCHTGNDAALVREHERSWELGATKIGILILHFV